MGFLTKPSVQSVNPNSEALQGLQGGFADMLGGLASDPNTLATSDLQRMGTDAIGAFLGANPEQQTFDQLMPGLMEIFGTNSAQGVGEAAFPLFQRGLQESLGQLANSGQGRFSTAFESQGVGLGQRALQDFNLLQHQAFQQNVGNQLGAAGLLGTLAQNAGGGAFGRAAQATGLGIQATQGNPALQTLLAGLSFGRPAPNDTVVGSSILDKIISGGVSLATMKGMGGGGGG